MVENDKQKVWVDATRAEYGDHTAPQQDRSNHNHWADMLELIFVEHVEQQQATAKAQQDDAHQHNEDDQLGIHQASVSCIQGSSVLSPGRNKKRYTYIKYIFSPERHLLYGARYLGSVSVCLCSTGHLCLAMPSTQAT